MAQFTKRGIGLRLKFTFLTMIIVVITVLMISLPLSSFMINNQRQSLADGLQQRVGVLLGSLISGAETYLPLQDRLELGELPKQISTLQETFAISISGAGLNDPLNFDYVWAHDDPRIEDKIVGGNYLQGESRIEDELTASILELQQTVNDQAKAAISELAAEADRLGAEAVEYSRQGNNEKVRELQQILRDLNDQIAEELQPIKTLTGVFPEFDSENLEPAYTFYRPIVYRSRGSDSYYRGVIRLSVSTERIIAEIQKARFSLIIRTGIIGLIAAGLGLIGAIVMASITVTPIRKLAEGVAVIRDTEDKEKLERHVIDVGTRDEIGTLAATVNQMTQGLFKAAVAAKDLTVGKDVQKMFIPLEEDASGSKLATGGEENDQIEIYGYYEGAKGVSGDYFYYTRLKNDEKKYAVIKCDVAGKGVPAALIMVQVATIFSNYFEQEVKTKDPGRDIDQLAYQINNALELRGFKGRFAALTMCVIDSVTGKSFFSHAGDEALHIYRKDERKVIQTNMPQAPAAGVFPSDLVEMQSGFQQIPYQFNSGDTVFLFTDGIEEAKRTFRNEQFEEIICDDPELKENQEHGGTHLKGSDNEELGIPRIHEIINSVFAKQSYTLRKYHNPMGDESLEFDFSGCLGTVEEAVLAMVSVEKVFRIYPDPGATEDDHVDVDPKIVEFLKKYFLQFDQYLSHPLESEVDGKIRFTHIKEDDQYDDLTILALRKK